MDNTAETQAFVDRFFKILSARDFESLGQFWTPDGIYWVSGNSSAPGAGKKQASERIPDLFAWFDAFATVDFHINNTVVQDRKAVVEFKVRGSTPDGLEYTNDVVMSLELNSVGEIVVLREYLDQMQVAAHLEAREKKGKT